MIPDFGMDDFADRSISHLMLAIRARLLLLGCTVPRIPLRLPRRCLVVARVLIVLHCHTMIGYMQRLQ